MTAESWTYSSACLLASITLAGYVATRTLFSWQKTREKIAKQTWSSCTWVEDILIGREAGPYKLREGDKEMLDLFPGWAARRYSAHGSKQAPSEIEVFVSGFASVHRRPENTIRSLRVAIWLAKRLLKFPVAVGHAFSDVSSHGRNFEGDAQRVGSSADILKSLHDNLETRISLLWRDPIPNRTVRLRIFVARHSSEDKDMLGKDIPDWAEKQVADAGHDLLASQDLLTTDDGSFHALIKVDWDAFNQLSAAIPSPDPESRSFAEHDLVVLTELVPPPEAPGPKPLGDVKPIRSRGQIALSDSRLRVISDIDDTVKHSGVLSGAKAVLSNVFCKDVKDTIIPEMGNWYIKMFNRGINFHYASNGLLSYLNVVSEFLHVSRLPPGSIKLRSYNGKLFSELRRSTAGPRKYASVIEIIDGFPDSKFVLIGDTGEMDLECYADLARDRPDQIVAVFIRDAAKGTSGAPDPVDDPTGSNVTSTFAETENGTRPLVPRRESELSFFTRALSSSRRRRTLLQMRIDRARKQMPRHVALRVFRDPTECVELDDILEKEVGVKW